MISLKKFGSTLVISVVSVVTFAASTNPVVGLVERIDRGSSKNFLFELTDQMSAEDFFEIDQKGSKVWIKGNNWISVATGLNWYLKYNAGIHISWNNPTARLGNLPKVKLPYRHSTDKLVRYYLNYCTFSYSMAWWDWERWQREIDWMALHGVNMPLALTGTATVWRNTLLELGFPNDQINQFIAGPGFQAWWLMNNLEGCGGPNPTEWYEKQAKLEQFIVARYREWGIEPVYAGYCGMIPSNSSEQLDLQIQDPGKWCGYSRPAFLQPTDPRFAEIAKIYYDQMEKLFGTASYYAMDPFHEGGSTANVDLKAAGTAIYDAMKAASPGAKWVIQAWQNNPHPQMIDHLKPGDVIVLDLFSESRPQWGDPRSSWYRKEGFGTHDWVYCMLLNFGGNTGMYGKMQRVIDGYYLAQKEHNGRHLVGVGATMEGIENNPAMYELIFELPWRAEPITTEQWLESWVMARYGRTLPQSLEAWKIIGETAYNPPYESTQEGTTESVICARPALKVDRTSSWGTAKMYYEPQKLEKALSLMAEVSEKYRGCNNFEYDIVDLARQAIANRANELLRLMETAFDKSDSLQYKGLSDEFLKLILREDQLLNSRREFMVGPWIASAMMNGRAEAEMDFYRWNARTLITTWGNQHAANIGGLRDYSHREWAGLLKDFYYPRWKYFFDYVNQHKQLPIDYDYYPMEESWATDTNPYPITPTTDAINESVNIANYLRRTRAELPKLNE